MLLQLLILWNWTRVTLALWNAAKWKPAYQSSDKVDYTWNLWKDNARRAVDGDRDPVPANGSCSLTRTNKPSWFIVDLQGQYSVKKVLLVNRVGDSLGNPGMLKNFRVEVHETDPRKDPLFPHVQGELCVAHGNTPLPSGDNMFICEDDLTGGFAEVIFQPGYEAPLSLCEFEVQVDAVFSTSIQYKKFHDARVTNSSFLTLDLEFNSALSCAAECNSRRDQELCTAFNWNQEQGECRLLNAYPFDDMNQVSDGGWDLYRVVTH